MVTRGAGCSGVPTGAWKWKRGQLKPWKLWALFACQEELRAAPEEARAAAGPPRDLEDDCKSSGGDSVSSPGASDG